MVAPLIFPVSDMEIHNVVLAGSSSKAPGPDGFTFEFYKDAWDIIGGHVCRAIKNFFSTDFLPRCAKATAIALIPKGTHASNILDYRPISLCNVFYKIIAKILSNRMKEVMTHIIHTSQTGFIKQRMSTDNIVLASEILSEFNSKPGENYFCAKLDIKKAFDTISRYFLLQRLAAKGFPPLSVSWIKGCIEDVYFSVAINGGLEGFFPSSSGLRQGCPLSPLLFSVVMDAFSCGLNNSNFSDISCDGFSVNHLLYADDILVFGKASLLNASTLDNVLTSFALHSSLMVNNAKCSIVFSKNTPQAHEITHLLGFTPTESTLTYLGIPISSKKLKTSHFQPLLSRLSTLLDGWKDKFLSFAGRIQFLKFTITNIVAYWIRGTVLPKGVCKNIEKLCAKFLFHGTHSGKKLHLIAWHKTCLPKRLGGLGLSSFASLSFAFGCTFIWRFYNSNSLAAGWFKHKFLSPWKPFGTKVSKFWKVISINAHRIKEKLNFHVVKDNCNLSALWDPWCQGISVIDFVQPEIFSGWLCDYIVDVSWSLPPQLGLEAYRRISNIPILPQPHPLLSWISSGNPTFNIFHKYFFDTFEEVPWFKYIWHAHYALRFSDYTWMALLDGLKTADVLAKRNIFIPTNCSFCRREEESVSHYFFQCDYTFAVISTLIPALRSFLLHPTLLQVFEFFDGLHNLRGFEKNFCYFVICCSLYHLWRERNERRYGNDEKDVAASVKKISHAITAKTDTWKHIDRIKQTFSFCFMEH
ncbi:Putative ribonuclease H protein [Dendrobium catenatum]|uniref:Ribonuclease H protein n=1 Tax=Dendrobium catenatum TaxID=906689 RepID=A0A2I0XFX0_9ASPA|nr:Putative ribonuclease H protein [Dendrobium catenatum]